MNDKNKIHIVPHTHWDREWYFTTARSKVYLAKNLKEILDTLESEKFKYFTLDAQASLLDDYLKWNIEDEDRVKRLVRNKKLIIGPWYTQTDQLVISAESIVRNLYYGIERCKELGGYMKVGYVPDSFGQSAQMPQIYNEFGIDSTMFWRGVSDDMVDNTEFMWKGSDESTILAVQIPFGYYYGGNIPEDEDDLKKYLEEYVERLKEKATTKNVYFPNGFDQAPIRKNLPKIIEKANEIDNKNHYEMSNIENYIKSVRDEAPTLDEIEGELVNAKNMRIHKSIFSSRADLKILNNKLENYIVNVLEPILTVSYSLGNEYPHSIMKDIWKLMFENSAHDSIGSCNSDTTNEDVYIRCKQAMDLSINLLDLHMRNISTRIKNDNKIMLTVFNGFPKKRNTTIEIDAYIPNEDFILKNTKGEIVDYVIKSKTDVTEYVLGQTIQLNPSKKIYVPKNVYIAKIVLNLKDISPLGYEQLYFELNRKNDNNIEKYKGKMIENEYYSITSDGVGAINILDKMNNKLYKNQAVIEDNGDDGDSYNYSPPRDDMYVSSLKSKADIEISKSKIYQEMTLTYNMKIPATLEERAESKCLANMPIIMKIRLDNNEKIIKFTVDIKNYEALSHRVRVLFDTEISSKFSIADQQFGIIKRPTILEKEIALWEKDQKNWQEKPITIEPMQSFVTLEDGKRGVAIITNCVREYQIVGNQYDIIALTLFRSFGNMGKENLLYRQGRASGEKIIKTPDAQLLKNLSFEFGMYVYSGKFDEANVCNKAKEFLTPIQVYQYADFLNGRVIFSFRDEKKIYDSKYSLFDIQKENFTVSAIKKEEKGEGILVRIFNAMKAKKAEGTINVGNKISLISTAKLDESYDEEGTEKIVDKAIKIKNLKHCKVRTLIIR